MLARLLETKAWLLTRCHIKDFAPSADAHLFVSRNHLNPPVQKRIVNEVEHGRFLAQHGAGEIWNWEGPAGRLRWVRRVKMLSNHLYVGMNVLELGCGTGYFTRELARSGAHIVAVDVSPELLENRRGRLFSAKCFL